MILIVSFGCLSRARLLFPQVQKLIFLRKENERPQISGFMTHSGILKNFLAPVPLDTTTDFIACKLAAALQAAYKDELNQNFQCICSSSIVL
jgi:hypothetical protein